jgi:hypothetical protein
MNWFAEVDAYCERIDATFWSEPVNAITNLAFVLAALFVWPRVSDTSMGRAQALILFAIGVGSGLNHTIAQNWAAAADSLSILAFILVYLFAATRDMLGQKTWVSVLAVMAFFPYIAVTIPVFSQFSFLGSSAAYAPVALLIGLYAFILQRRAAATARGMWIGAGLLTVSILLRAADEPICELVPLGTHFTWHILNAIMLGHMILTWRAHVLAGVGRAG